MQPQITLIALLLAAGSQSCDPFLHDIPEATRPALAAVTNCGDGVVQAEDEGEQCDDGDRATEVCAYGETSCRVCDGLCQEVAGV